MCSFINNECEYDNFENLKKVISDRIRKNIQYSQKNLFIYVCVDGMFKCESFGYLLESCDLIYSLYEDFNYLAFDGIIEEEALDLISDGIALEIFEILENGECDE